jgi:dipeptidyl aminopeptidase/acylaminoacyl peptidase
MKSTVRFAWRALAFALAVLPLSQAAAELPPLISREVLFGNPEKANPRLSPDGKRLAYLAPDKKNVLQVWVQTVGKDDAQVVTADKKRGIRIFFWADDNKTLLYEQDGDGDENFHLHGVDLETKNVRDYTPFQGVRASVVDMNRDFPDQVLVSLNLRKREAMDVYRLNLRTGAVELDTENPGDVNAWVADAKMVVRGAQVPTPDGGTELRVRDGVKAPWRTLLKAGPEENLSLAGFSLDGKSVVLQSSLGADTARVVERNLKTGAEKVLAESAKVDAGPMLVHPTKHQVQAVSFAVGRREWTVVDPSVKADFEGIAKLNDGDFMVGSRNHADDVWLVAFTRDRGSPRFFAWDRKAKKGTHLFDAQPKLEGLTLAEMKPVVIPSRDGLELHSYLTLPPGVPAKGLPMVLLVHGGPWGRDSWGANPSAQWLANRGYAVLQVNFRGSAGFGKKFLHAGDRQWGLKMHDDLLDSVEWAVKQGYVDRSKVAIMGGSYGGYAALAGATFTPDAFKCAVDIVGPSNLFTLLKTIPPYWKPMKGMFAQRVGNIEDPKDEELLKKASPLFSADKIKIPMLIGQGANDPRVKQAESEQIVEAIAKNGKKATYVLYPDEGHGFARPENRIDFNARVESFLAENLGGRAEPLPAGDKVPGSTAVVRVVGGTGPQAAAGSK